MTAWWTGRWRSNRKLKRWRARRIRERAGKRNRVNWKSSATCSPTNSWRAILPVGRTTNRIAKESPGWRSKTKSRHRSAFISGRVKYIPNFFWLDVPYSGNEKRRTLFFISGSGVSCKARNKKKRPIVVITFILESHEFYECWGEFRAYHLLGLAVLDAPAGDCQSAVTRRDDEVAFVWNGRQGGDAVEAEEAHAHSDQITTCNSWMILLANSTFLRNAIWPSLAPIRNILNLQYLLGRTTSVHERSNKRPLDEYSKRGSRISPG